MVKGIKHMWKVFVVEQFDNQLFNRGYLFNVGFHFATLEEQKTGEKFDCVVMHDIDILPTPVVDYGWCQWPNQLSGEIEQGPLAKGSAGGVRENLALLGV
ncbi:unnamed protein product [Effrenium voratum]|nr:unnamed protein product [Effrenium voratum]